MNSRERVQAVLQGERPDRLPFNFWMDRDRMAELDARWGADFRLTHFDVDVIEGFAMLPFWAGIPVETINDGKTVWQTKPMVDSLEQVLDHPLPDPTDETWLQDVRMRRAQNPDKAIWLHFPPAFALLEPLRMAENLFLDVYDDPETMHAVMQRILSVQIPFCEIVCKEDFDVLYIAHDICSRNGAMLSPKQLREFHLDYTRPLVEIAHAAGKKVWYHTDGYVLPILDLLVEYGFDGVNPLEPRYNDGEEFMHRFGNDLMLYGGGDNCVIIPDKTPEEVRAHVRHQFETFGQSGRFIFSTHDIPSHCPDENLEAMVDEIKHCTY